jgi:hypothetical protein
LVTKIEAIDVKARLAGTPERLAGFLRDWPLEVFDVRRQEQLVEVTVYVRSDVVDAAVRAGLRAEVLRNLTSELRKLPIGEHGRFTGGAIPIGLGLRPRAAPP